MITTSIIQIVDFHFPSSPVNFDTRPILCRGYRKGKHCECREFVKWRTVGGYIECLCGDSEQTHKPKSDKKRTAKR